MYANKSIVTVSIKHAHNYNYMTSDPEGIIQAQKKKKLEHADHKIF